MSGWEPYEGSARQRRTRRRQRVVALLVAVALLVPIVVGTVDALSR